MRQFCGLEIIADSHNLNLTKTSYLSVRIAATLM